MVALLFKDQMQNSGHILAYYVETGELPYPEMIKTLSRHLQDLKDQKNER
jgi:hypothetical protein